MDVTKGDLTAAPAKFRKRVCKCRKPCTVFLTLSDYWGDSIMCEKAARNLAIEIMKKSNFQVREVAIVDGRIFEWTAEEEFELIDYIEKSGVDITKQVPRNFYKKFADKTGRSNKGVWNKVKRLQKKGLI